ncbi:MAG: hypothetical protein JWO89_2538 [Verrucomicrobiaceae bacterium]|nr:hypothetical protein [Verrucomicrobiaceae bacterium]
MSRVALRFPRKAKALLYGNILLSFCTGVVWFALHRWGKVEGEFGTEFNPLEPWLLKIHGASAFLAMMGFGYLLATHVHVGWRSRRNRRLGMTLVGTVALLMLSGYLLYYSAGEDFRSAVSWVHLGLGVSLPLTLGTHVWLGHRRR